jgi:hypothetical protein
MDPSMMVCGVGERREWVGWEQRVRSWDCGFFVGKRKRKRKRWWV